MGKDNEQTVGYKYYLGMHMVMCHGPVDALLQIKADAKLAWGGTSTGGPIYVSAEGLFGGEDREGGISGEVDFEQGGAVQAPNAYLQSQLDNVPGFRGVAALVLKKCYMGMNPYLKRWSVVMQRIHVRNNGATQWYDAKAAIGRLGGFGGNGGGPNGQIATDVGGSDEAGLGSSPSGATVFSGPSTLISGVVGDQVKTWTVDNSSGAQADRTSDTIPTGYAVPGQMRGNRPAMIFGNVDSFAVVGDGMAFTVAVPMSQTYLGETEIIASIWNDKIAVGTTLGLNATPTGITPNIYFPGNKGSVYLYDDTGAFLYEFEAAMVVESMALSGSTLYILSNDDMVYTYDISTSLGLFFGAYAAPAGSSHIFVSDTGAPHMAMDDGSVQARVGSNWQFLGNVPIGGDPGSVSVVDGTIYAILVGTKTLHGVPVYRSNFYTGIPPAASLDAWAKNYLELWIPTHTYYPNGPGQVRAQIGMYYEIFPDPLDPENHFFVTLHTQRLYGYPGDTQGLFDQPYEDWGYYEASTTTDVYKYTEDIVVPVYTLGGADAGANGGLDPLDMNPAHIIRECLTDTDWGMGYAEEDIDDTSFTAAADTLYAEGLGMSMVWDRQIPIEEFIKDVKKTINAALYVDRTTGRFVLQLIRDDYDVDTLPLFDESNIASVDSFDKRGFDDLTNSVTVQYADNKTGRDASAELQDIAQIQMQGAVIGTTAKYMGVSCPINAAILAARELKTLSAPLRTCSITTRGAAAQAMHIGSVFKFSWDRYDVVEAVMRVAKISFGDGKNNAVKIQAVEDVFTAPDVSYVSVDPSGWTDISVPPAPTANELAFELPYYELVQNMRQSVADSLLAENPDAGYAGVAARRPAGAISATLATDAGAGYAERGGFDFCPVAALDSAIDKNTVSVLLANPSRLSLVLEGTHAQIGDEIVVVESIASNVLTFKRGALDTVPADHAAGTAVFFWDRYFGYDKNEYNTAEEIGVKALPITGLGQLSLVDADEMLLTLNQRALRPYPPGAFAFDGEFFPTAVLNPSFEVTWTHRDRLQQTGGTLLSFLDGSVGPEAGTTYNGFAYNDDDSTLLDSATGISGTSWFPTLAASYRLRVEVESVRDSLTSWQRQRHTFDYVGADGRITEDEDPRFTDSDELRITE